jgi:hypothetical protein
MNNAVQVHHTVPTPREGIQFIENSPGCGWGNIHKEGGRVIKVSAKFFWETRGGVSAHGVQIPEDVIVIGVWKCKKDCAWWDEAKRSPEFRYICDLFSDYPTKAWQKKYILMGLPGNRREHDGVIMDLIHDSFIPWE